MSHEKGIEAATCAVKDAAEDRGVEIGGVACRQYATEAIKAYLDASGMVMVPRRVSRDMDSAGYDACPWNILDPSKKDHQEVYYAMIAAAPNPFQTPEESREKK